MGPRRSPRPGRLASCGTIGVRARARGVLTALLVMACVWSTGISTASADPTPAATGQDAAALAGGWLARQITASGSPRGTNTATDVRPAGWAVLGMLAGGVGETAAGRATAAISSAMTDRPLDEVATGELAMAIVVRAARNAPLVVGPDDLDLVAALQARTQSSGVDEGLIGSSSLLQEPVTTHSLGLLALRAAGVQVTEAQRRWLVEQQCPSGGWPLYRSAPARSTGTCELLVPDMSFTALAAQAAAAAGIEVPFDVEPFLRASSSPTGGFAPAPGLPPTPVATAQGISAHRALLGSEPDETWAGTAGTPQQVLLAEQLGCGWHGEDRGAVPDRMLDTAGDVTQPSADEPGVAGPVEDVAAAALAWAGVLLPAVPGGPRVGDPFPDCPVATSRAAGSDRVATAVALSTEAFPDGAPAAVVATASGYADALAATALAGRLGGPVLLTPPADLPTVVIDELTRLGVEEVVLMGGPAALARRVEATAATVETVDTVRRIAGDTRFQTAAAAADEVGGNRAFLARGAGPADRAPWADALAVGAWAATQGIPVLLTEADVLPEETAAALDGRAEVILVGGTAAVSEAVAQSAASRADAIRRIGGGSRLATSALVFAAARADGVDVDRVAMATSADYPDALAAGPAVAALGGSLLLVDPSAGMANADTANALLDVDFVVDDLLAVGGVVGLPAGVLADAAVLVREGADG